MPSSLKAISEQVESCRKCNLGNLRTRSVFGRGSAAAPLLVVGEAPGYHEDLEGVPFCGAAGQLLDRVLEVSGIPEDLVYVTNIIKCRPPNNEVPSPRQIGACAAHLDEQVRAIAPAALLLLGRSSVSAVACAVGSVEALIKLGALSTRWGIPAFAAYHPSYLLRQYDEDRDLFALSLRAQVGAFREAARAAGILQKVARVVDAEHVSDGPPPHDHGCP